MRGRRAADCVRVWQLADRARAAVLKLTACLDGDRRLREQVEDAAADIGRSLETALAVDHAGEFARCVRRARAAVSDVQAGLRIAVLKKRLPAAAVGDAGELLSRLHPALSALLATASSPSETPDRSPSCTRPSAASSRT